MRSLIPAILMFCLASCIYHRKAYYSSPVNGLTNPYTPIPLQSDSTRSAYYINTTLSGGSANDRGHDNSFAFQTNLAGAGNFKNFQIYYGTGIELGNYSLNAVDASYSTTVEPRVINKYAGDRFFGAVGFNGGMNAVVSIGGGGEWRVVGIETSLYREFGDYLSVRRSLPDTAATYINRRSFFGTFGGYTEIVGKIRNGSLNFKFGGGTVLGKSYHNVTGVGDYGYFNFTIGATIRKWSPYFQGNFASKADNVLFGLSYRLGR